MPRKPQTAGPKIRLFLVDDEPAVRRGLQLLLSLHANLEVCGEAESEFEALERIPASKPDLAVVDLNLKGGDGLDLIKKLRPLYPALKILVFSMYNQVHYAAAAFAAGAHGYVTKEEGTEKALEAVQAVIDGKFYLSEKIAAKAPNLPRETRHHHRTRLD